MRPHAKVMGVNMRPCSNVLGGPQNPKTPKYEIKYNKKFETVMKNNIITQQLWYN
jgi:hypothetical protein